MTACILTSRYKPAIVLSMYLKVLSACVAASTPLRRCESNGTYDLTSRMMQTEVVQPISQAGWCENFIEAELDPPECND